VIGMRRLTTVTAVVLVGLIVAAAGLIVRETLLRSMTITADFSSATGIYPGDDVRVSGVKVGSISSIQPQPDRARLVLKVRHGVAIPADAKAVIVAQNLVAARYVQLTPAYHKRDGGPKMNDGAVIPRDRTAAPVEWDEVKAQLTRLATDLGPKGSVSTTSVGHFIEATANALDGNGEKLRQTLAQLSGVGRILADRSGNIVDIIKNLQLFVSTLRDSNQQIVQFENRLATLSSVLNDSRSDLDAALTELSTAVEQVQRFIAETRDKTAEQLERVRNVTQTLVDRRLDIENILHVAPTAFSNGYNIYKPNIPGAVGTFIINNFANPVEAVCSALGAVENITAAETGKLCSQYLGPGLRTLNFNYVPIPTNLALQPSATPDKIKYAEPRLAPGGEGPSPSPPETPPAVSAYTGWGDSAPKNLPELLLPAPPELAGQPPGTAPPGQGTTP
jgi:phospholipid/cholesterol/gamma-HCH transport system substrate-binding protein